MRTLINRCDLKQALLKYINFQAGDSLNDYSITIDELYDLLDNAPTVEQPQGDWIVAEKVVCAQCPFCEHIFNQASNFCPNCGAKMKQG